MKCNVTFSLVVFTSIICLLCVGSQNTTSSASLSTLSSAGPDTVTEKPSRHNGTKPKPIKCDLYCCNCNGDKARCTGQDQRRYHYLPQLPAKIRDFRMFRSQFYHLNRTMMLKLSNFELTTINLTDNQIHHIAPDTFAAFPKMKTLDLSYNPIPFPQVRACLKGISSPALATLNLAAMGYTFLPDDFFDMFRNMIFKKVDLQQNKFGTFSSALFQPFRRVDYLNMLHNDITDVNIPVRVNIKHLILEHNLLSEFPDLSLNKSQTKEDEVCQEGFYYLQKVTIIDNPLRRINPRVLRGDCLPHLRNLDISSAWSLDVLENNFIADLPALLTLTANNNNIKRYQRYAFNSSSLEKLFLNGNKRFDKDTVYFSDMFKHCPNVKHLTLVNTKLEMDERQMYRLLQPLRSVEFLNMQRNSKGNIPPNLLSQLTSLKRLIFAGNNLNSYSLGRALENVTHLKVLNVQANGIMAVNESTLPWEFRQNLIRIDLSQNPFSCTCDLMWFRNWVDDVTRNKSVTVDNFNSRDYRCRTPADMAESPLHAYRPTPQSCAVRNPFILVGAVGACFLMGLLILLSLVYRYRWHLRYYVYRLRRRQQYVQVPGGLLSEDRNQVQLFPYDAYLAHSPSDVDWVVQTLLPVLEDEHGLKVFLDERDSVPGTNLVDNITRYMDESARVLLLISNHYNREGWRQCEFEHILYAAFEQQKDVIVLLLGDVEAGRMTRDMRKMLTRGTFLQWESSEEAQKAFFNGLKIAMKTKDDSFQAIC